MKENVKKLSNCSAHNFTNHRSWYPLPENTMLFLDIPQLSELPAVKMSSKDQQVLIELSNVYVWLIRQRTGRQEATMAKVGTLPSFCYNNTHADAQVPLPQTMNEFNSEKPMDEKAKNDNGEYAEVEDEVTFSLSSGDEDFAGEIVSRENFFLIGANTKYDQTIRVNTSIYQ